MSSRVSALDETAMTGLADTSSRTRPTLQIELFPPQTPVFSSLQLTKAPRTNSNFLRRELAGVLQANNYKDVASAATAAIPRLESLGIFEPGTVSLSLERAPKLLVDTDDAARPPPVLVFRAVEKDILRLEAKPTATINGISVGSAEVGYEASGMLRNGSGRGELLSGRYYSQNGCPPEVHASVTAPVSLVLPPSLFTWPAAAAAGGGGEGGGGGGVALPLTVTAEVCREELSQRTTSSLTAEKCVGRLTIRTASSLPASPSSSKNGSSGSSNGSSVTKREHTLEFEAGSRRVLPVTAVEAAAVNVSTFSMPHVTPSTMFPSTAASLSSPFPSPSPPPPQHQHRTFTPASAPVLEAAAKGSSAKVSAAYMYRRSSVTAFTAPPPPPHNALTSPLASAPPFPPLTPLPLLLLAAGAVPISGWVGAGSVEVATGAKGWRSLPFSPHDANFVKFGVSAKQHVALTRPYTYNVPQPPSTKDTDGSGGSADPPSPQQQQQRGCAAGVTLSLSADAALLYPTTTNGSDSSSNDTSSSSSSSHLLDRFHLGGPHNVSNGATFAGGSGSFRGFSANGIGPRANNVATALNNANDHHRDSDGSNTNVNNNSNRGWRGWFSARSESNGSGDGSSSSLSSGDALGGNGRFTCCALLTAPVPLPQLAMAGLRASLSLHAGALTTEAPSPLPSLSSLTLNQPASSVPAAAAAAAAAAACPAAGGGWQDALRACVTVGVGLPLGENAFIEVLCSKHLVKQPHDRAETWQLAMGIGLG